MVRGDLLEPVRYGAGFLLCFLEFGAGNDSGD